MKHQYAKPAGISAFIHIALLCLATMAGGPIAPNPASPAPPPIEVEIEPSRLLDMGSGKLQFTSGSPRPGRREAKPRTRVAAAKPDPPKAAPAAQTDPLPPALPGETNADSVALPLPGERQAEDGSLSHGAGRGSGAGTDAAGGEGSGEGGEGDYAGAGYRYGALPGYPSSARRAGREGVVTVRVLVGTDGTPASVMVRETSGHEDFDNAAVQAVRKWRFSPARRGVVPVASFHDVRVRFRLGEAR